MPAKTYPLYLAGKASQPNAALEVLDKYSGKLAARVALADTRMIDKAIAAAVKAEAPMRKCRPMRASRCSNIASRVFANARTNSHWPSASKPASRSSDPKARSPG